MDLDHNQNIRELSHIKRDIKKPSISLSLKYPVLDFGLEYLGLGLQYVGLPNPLADVHEHSSLHGANTSYAMDWSKNKIAFGHSNDAVIIYTQLHNRKLLINYVSIFSKIGLNQRYLISRLLV